MSLRLPRRLTEALFCSLVQRVALARQPDVIISGRADPYLFRWWVVPRNRWFNVYLHRFMRSDDDRALHDHPWVNLSVLLDGEYDEHTIQAGGVEVRTRRQAGDLKLRLPSAAHRIELLPEGGGLLPCWTLFITGPRMRNWGFHCRKGWVRWETFTNPADGGATVGQGCGELA